jgi:hypothetical protein
MIPIHYSATNNTSVRQLAAGKEEYVGRGFRGCLKNRKILGVGVGVGIGFYERHDKQELIFFDPDSDPDSDPDPDVRHATPATH